jgi:IclR family acetate operon transcriptional repressor
MASAHRQGARRVAAVGRALAVLDALADGGDLGTNELARRTGVNASTVSRLLVTLCDGGLVAHVPDSGRYRLGLRLVEYGNAALAALDVRGLARPHLHALVAETGETATLSVPGERDAVTVDFVQSPRSVQSVARIGRPSVGHATAAGKAMLAFSGVMPSGTFERFTERTIVDPALLARELERVRERGWADAVEEREPGLVAIAAPVRGPGGELVAILGVQGPSERFDRAARKAAVAPLVDHAGRLSTGLGGSPPARD